MEVIKLENVSKIFGDKYAVNNISFSVGSGKIFGILGPNGAGKTTTIRMLTNIYVPDGGRILIKERPIDSKHQNIIGYLPEERGLYKKIKVLDQLVYFGRLKGMSSSDATHNAKAWLKELDASDWAGKKIQELSKGMQQKVQFISTILHNPEIIILDEPFSGFDPVNVEMLRNIILKLRDDGKTIFLSTHVMEQVEQMCDDICLINKGQTVLSGNVRKIKAGYGNDTVILEFDGDPSFINSFENIKILKKSSNRLEMKLLNGMNDYKELLKKSVEMLDISRFELVEPSLNEIFINSVSGKGGND